MKNYKIEFTKKEFYIIDIKANNQKEAEILAKKELTKLFKSGTEHYHEHKDPELDISAVFDVTGTDDPFTPLND